MAETIESSGTYGTYYYINSSSSRDVLTWEQMKANALYFYSACKVIAPNWTLNAISAMLGNIRYEGVLNPSQWQYGSNKNPNSGYGLVQWTPATKFINWANENGYPIYEIDGQIERILYEVNNPSIQWISTNKYPLSFSEFVSSNDNIEELASAWLYNYERPKDPKSTESYRRDMTVTWYEFLSGEEPNPPEPPTPPKKKRKRMPIYMYPAFRKENLWQ